MTYLFPVVLSWLTCSVLLYLSAKVWRLPQVSLLVAVTACFFWLILDSILKYSLFLLEAYHFPTTLTLLISGLAAAAITAGMSKHSFKRSLLATYTVLLLYWLILLLWIFVLGPEKLQEANWVQYIFGIPKLN